MDETLSEHGIGAAADRVLMPGPPEKISAAVARQSEPGYGRASPATLPGLQLPAGMAAEAESARPQQRQRPVQVIEPAQTGHTGQPGVSDVLHVGCGSYGSEKLPLLFRNSGWREIRLDIDPQVDPDIVASITGMQAVADAAVDAVYSSHNIEHLYPHEVPLALREMNRVLKPDGYAFICLPDLQEVARFVADGKLEDPLYVSPMGEIAPLDILYGHRPSLALGNTFMAHRTGFTGSTLGTALIAAGFAAVMMQRDLPNFSLTAIAFRARPDAALTATWRARLLPAADRPTVLYTRND